MRIAVFDYQVIRSNPVGGCHLRMLRALAKEHDFTVFSVQFDNPCPERIRWVRIPAPVRPLPLLFVAVHILAPVFYLIERLRTRRPFDLVQTVESKLSFGDVIYSHFCHRSYLREHWQETNSTGIRGWSRWLDHKLHAMVERRTYRRAKKVIVPSQGLSRELVNEFHVPDHRIDVLPNAIDVERLQIPETFNRADFRQALGFIEQDIVLIFSALGHFERKGLPLILEALGKTPIATLKLLVVGGTKDLIEHYVQRVSNLGLAGRVQFAGAKSDVRPYLWAADAFVLASNYETFSLVAFEAAAASLPLITTRVHGVGEIIKDGETGYVIRRTVKDLVTAFERMAETSRQERRQMGAASRAAAARYDERAFVERWREFYAGWAMALMPGVESSTAGQQDGRSMPLVESSGEFRN